MFSYFQQRSIRKARARQLYQQATHQARHPDFYTVLGVPDTVDGRFEMVCLHCYLLMRRLRQLGHKKLSQALFDVFFVNMDQSLREMGVGDLGVPKHMKRMMKGFNGRSHRYEAAFGHGDDVRAGLEDALHQNVYATCENQPDTAMMSQMVDYILLQEKALASCDLAHDDMCFYTPTTGQEDVRYAS